MTAFRNNKQRAQEHIALAQQAKRDGNTNAFELHAACAAIALKFALVFVDAYYL